MWVINFSSEKTELWSREETWTKHSQHKKGHNLYTLAISIHGLKEENFTQAQF